MRRVTPYRPLRFLEAFVPPRPRLIHSSGGRAALAARFRPSLAPGLDRDRRFIEAFFDDFDERCRFVAEVLQKQRDVIPSAPDISLRTNEWYGTTGWPFGWAQQSPLAGVRNEHLRARQDHI